MADGNSELFAAFDGLKTGIQEYQQTQAVRETRAQLDAINAQGMKEDERSAAVAQLGQGLALRLSGAHANPAAIQAAISTLTPSASEADQARGTQKVEAMKTGSAEKIEGMKTNSAEKIEQMKVDAVLGKQDQKTKEAMMKFGTEFQNQKQIKPILENLPKIDDALQKITENKGQFGATAMINLAKLGLIRGAAGRVNEMEIKGSDESPSMKAQLWKKMGLESTGEVPVKVQDFWQKVLQKSKDNIHSQLHDAAEGFAASKATFNDKLDAGLISKGLHQQFGIKVPESKANPNQAAINAAKAWLSIPANAQSPDARGVQDTIKKLEVQP